MQPTRETLTEALRDASKRLWTVYKPARYQVALGNRTIAPGYVDIVAEIAVHEDVDGVLSLEIDSRFGTPDLFAHWLLPAVYDQLAFRTQARGSVDLTCELLAELVYAQAVNVA
jgi:hypothetical protein